MIKHLQQTILTSKWHVKHTLAGRNTQQVCKFLLQRSIPAFYRSISKYRVIGQISVSNFRAWGARTNSSIYAPTC